MNIDAEGLQEAAADAMRGVDITATQQLFFDFAVLGVVALAFFGIFIAIYIPFKRHNLARNEAEGVITDTHAAYMAASATVEAGEIAGETAERPVIPIAPKVLTWGFWATMALGLGLMIAMQQLF
jgi:hypothetical protein